MITFSNSIVYSDVQLEEEILKNKLSSNLDKTYKNPRHNLNVTYPSNWKELSNIDNVTLISPLENKSDSFQENIILTVESKGNIELSNIELKNMISVKITEYKQNLDEFTLLDFKKDILDGNSAYKIIYSYKQGNNSFTKLEIFTNVGSKTYSFYYLAEANKYNLYLPIINEIINTIEIQGLITPESKSNDKSTQLNISIDPWAMVASSLEKLYIINTRFNTISVVDSSTDKIIREIKVGRFPISIDIDNGLNNIFVANSRSNSTSVINGFTDEVKELDIGKAPGFLVVDDTEKGLNSLVFVANYYSNSISVIDGDKMEVMKEEIKTEENPAGIALNKITNTMYITNSGSDSVSVIDYFLSKDGSFHYNNTTTIKVGKSPTGIHINPETNKIYVANSYDNSVSVINGSSGTIEKIVSVGIWPLDVEVDPKANKIYVTNYLNNTVSIINGSKDDIITNLHVGLYPNTIYLNPINNIIYIINKGSNTISQIQDTFLLTGITYIIQPPNSGQLDCNGKKILENDYIKYKLDSEIECTAFPNSEYEFKSWSADLKLKSDSKNQAKFNAARYANITANFQAPIELNLPEGYWTEVRLAVASVVFPAIIGWLIPSIASFINGTKQRNSMRKIMQEIIVLQKNIKVYDNETYKRKLLEIQDEIIRKLISGKISESQYEILNSKIGNLQKE